MPNAPSISDEARVPSHGCIQVEDRSELRTSDIDAEWDLLSFASSPESALPTVTARPRLETLPGLGPDQRRALAPKPRRSDHSRFLMSMLAATLVIALGRVTVLYWGDSPEIVAPPALVTHVQSNLVAVQSAPSPSPSPPVVDARVESVAPASLVEPTPAKPAQPSKPAPRAAQTARAVRESSANSGAARGTGRSQPALASSDNPY